MEISRVDKEFLLCFFAGQAMQGILAHEGPAAFGNEVRLQARWAVDRAKALLEELEAQGDA